MNKNHLFIILFLLCLALGCIFYYDNTTDDAFISLRYARNLANGFGLRFNPNDLQPVEAYTNFALVLLQSLFFLFNTDVFLIITITGLISLVLCFYAISRTDKEQMPAALLALSGFHGLFFWAFSGLETAILAAIILLWNISFLQKKYRKCAFYGFVCVLLRPDSMLVFFAHLLFLIFEKDKTRVIALGTYLSGFVILLLSYAIFKFRIFGNLLPNTFYAKVSFSMPVLTRGLHYLGENLLWPEILILIFLSLYRLKKNPDRNLKLALTIFTLYCIYAISCGGDFLPLYRFIFPCIPLLLSATLKKNDSKLALCFPLAFILTTVLPEYPSVFRESAQADIAVTAAHSLAEKHPPGSTAVTAASGIINFFCDWQAIDLYGLTDSKIARRKMPAGKIGAAGHDKYDITYVLRQKPEIIIPFFWSEINPGPVDIRTIDSLNPTSESYQALSELFRNKDFRQDYYQSALALNNEKIWFIYFIRKPNLAASPTEQ